MKDLAGRPELGMIPELVLVTMCAVATAACTAGKLSSGHDAARSNAPAAQSQAMPEQGASSGSVPGAMQSATGGSGASLDLDPGDAIADGRADATLNGPEEEGCEAPRPGRAPIRRLTRFEYNRTVASLLADDTAPADSLPAELLGNGFGNDADQQPVSSFLVEQYSTIARDVAQRAVQRPDVIGRYAPCFAAAAVDNEEACARTFIETFASKAYRRPLEPAEIDDLVALERNLRQGASLSISIGGVIQAILQGPDFLYRPEFGVEAPDSPGTLRPSGPEMASRLSYLFWGTAPDDALWAAADSGALLTDEGILGQAQRLLADPRARTVVRFFFDHYLPLNTLTDLARDPARYPTFSPAIGALMREETWSFLEYEIFEGPGTWPAALTAPYTFVNEPLADFYGIEGVLGDAFVQVDLDTTRRLGLLTQGGVMAGTTISNYTNPVRRGVFLLRNIMCLDLPEPPAALANDIKPPDPELAATGRQRYSQHSKDPTCAGCHAVMDPPGFALENYDAVGLFREQENGVAIDASGELNVLPEPFDGPADLVRLIAASPKTHDCFASKWMTFAYGRALEQEDACTTASVYEAFASSGQNVQQLLLSLARTDAFVYLSREGRR